MISDCGPPPGISHGTVRILEGSYRTYDSVALVTCDNGYKTDNKFVACQESGEWEKVSCEGI